MESGYYEAYNRDNVQLVDIAETPISRITEHGVLVGDTHHDLDIIIYATGFDGVTGSLDRIDFRGRGGLSLREAWADGPATYLGMQVVGFPNFFTLVGAHNGASFCNIGVCGALQAEWVAGMIGYLRAHGLCSCEPAPDYQERWTAKCYDDYAKTLLADSDAWWAKTTTLPDGTVRRRALIYVGGAPEYRDLCDQIAARGYEGFQLA
jgi:cyclohexanone monooxygenase